MQVFGALNNFRASVTIVCMVETTLNGAGASFNQIADPEIEEMVKAGVHMGHSKGKTHPAMQPYIFGVRNTVATIDLIKTKDKLAEALSFIKSVVAKNGLILLVGTRPAARKAILEVAQNLKMPYFVDRWIGGTLTNFKEISGRVEYMEKLEHEKRSGEWEKYTKKEQLEKDWELEKLKKNFDGIRSMKRLPQAVFIIDIIEGETAVHEARLMKIPSVALCDTNTNAESVDYPIPSNDDAVSAVRYMVGRIAEAIEEGKKAVQEKV